MAQQEETAFGVPPVDQPAQFESPQLSFLPEVDSFLWVSQARHAFNASGAGLAVAVLDTGLNSRTWTSPGASSHSETSRPTTTATWTTPPTARDTAPT